MGVLSIVVIATLGWVEPARDDPRPDKPPALTRFVLGIKHDGSLTLDGKAVTEAELAREWPRLAEQARQKAKTNGKPLDPKQSLPAVIVFWAVDETPYSLFHTLASEAQKSGFQQWRFARKSVDPDPSQQDDPPAQESTTRTESEPSALPEELLTLPIRLRADREGNLSTVALGEVELQDFKSLRFEISQIRDNPDTPFDRALLKIDPKLAFSELVRVIELLNKYKFTKIDLAEVVPERDR
jgi:biopolymer transport protein ExbD